MATPTNLRTPRLKRVRRAEQFSSYTDVPVLSQAELLQRVGSQCFPNDRKLGAIIAKRAICAAFTAEQWHELNTCVVDLLADLRHLCDTDGLDFAALDREAYAHYCAELYGDDAFLPALEGVI